MPGYGSDPRGQSVHCFAIATITCWESIVTDNSSGNVMLLTPETTKRPLLLSNRSQAGMDPPLASLASTLTALVMLFSRSSGNAKAKLAELSAMSGGMKTLTTPTSLICGSLTSSTLTPCEETRADGLRASGATEKLLELVDFPTLVTSLTRSVVGWLMLAVRPVCWIRL